MHEIVAQRPLLDQWNNNYIQPGGQGSVGATLVQTRLRRSNAEMIFTIEPNDPRKGSNITDGNFDAMYTLGSGPRVFDTNWSNRSTKVAHGEVWQDLRAVDRSVQPLMGDTPQYSWQNRVATAYKVTGQKFLPLPGGYAPVPGQISRGQEPLMYPIATATTAPPSNLTTGLLPIVNK